MSRGGTVLAALLCTGVALARAEPVPDGRALFQGYATPAVGGEILPASLSACMNCHGARALGGGEGLLRAPAVTWDALTRARGEEAPYGSPLEILAAIKTGKGRGGRVLSGAMPRFRLDNAEASALIAYLERAGTPDDRPPGVTAAEIRLGTFLPLEGSGSPVGLEILEGLTEIIASVNSAGGVHGRRIVLDAAGGDMQSALRHWTTAPVYALVGSILPESDFLAQWQAQQRISAIAGLSVRPSAAGIDPWSFDLLPPLDAQRSALVEALGACPAMARRVVLFPGKDSRPELTDAVDWFTDAASFKAAIREAGPEGCVGETLADVAVAAKAAPLSWRHVTVLPVPVAILGKAETGATPSLWRQLGRASARIIVELLAAAGPVLHERALLDGVAGLDGFEPLPGAPLAIRRGKPFAYAPGTIVVEPTDIAQSRQGTVQ